MKIITKQPNEIVPVSMQFDTGSYPVGATLSSATAATTDWTTGASTTSAVLSSGTCTVASMTAKCVLKACAAGKHKLTYTCTFSDGSVLEEDVQVVVAEI